MTTRTPTAAPSRRPEQAHAAEVLPRPALRLGLRLAWSPAGRARWRTLTMALAALAGTVLLLITIAFTQAVADQADASSFATPLGLRTAMRSVVFAIALPVVVGLVTIARLSARLRDERLEGLRLLGLTPAQLRVVAGVEVGVGVMTGWLLGAISFQALIPLLTRWDLTGQRYSAAQLQPGWSGQLLVFALVPLVVVGLAAMHRRSSKPLQAARAGSPRTVGWWRVVPLLLGVGVCLWMRSDTTIGPNPTMAVFLAGAALLATGTLLVLPVFQRVLAVVLLRLGRPSTTIAGRSLQAQPGATTRVLGVLLIALFFLTGTRAIAVAFEAVPQYLAPHYDATVESTSTVDIEGRGVAEAVAELEALPGIRAAVPLRMAGAKCSVVTYPEAMVLCDHRILVASCPDLMRAEPEITACDPTRPALLTTSTDDAGLREALEGDGSLALEADDVSREGRTELDPVAVLRPPFSEYRISERASIDHDYASAFVPLEMLDPAAVGRLPVSVLWVRADPSTNLMEYLESNGFRVTSGWSMEEYQMVRVAIQTLELISLLVLAIGLLTVGASGVDRVVEKRREIIGLQLVGVPARVLRRSHLMETGLPIVVGSALAIGLGALVGDTYLDLGGDTYRNLSVPAEFLIPLVVGAVLGGALIALLAAALAAPRIRPELIRAE